MCNLRPRKTKRHHPDVAFKSNNSELCTDIPHTTRTRHADEETGKYSLGFADGLAHSAMQDPAWPKDKPYPKQIEDMVQAVIDNRTNKSYVVAPGTVNNPARGVQMEDRVCRGDYRFVRVSNLGDFKPFPKCHLYLTWSEILGQVSQTGISNIKSCATGRRSTTVTSV